MEMVVVGIDVAKAGLDVHVLPAGEAFAVGRDAAGIEALIGRLRPLAPAMVAIEATGGLESVVAAGLGRLTCRSSWSIRRRCGPSP
jgi:transposase